MEIKENLPAGFSAGAGVPCGEYSTSLANGGLCLDFGYGKITVRNAGGSFPECLDALLGGRPGNALPRALLRVFGIELPDEVRMDGVPADEARMDDEHAMPAPAETGLPEIESAKAETTAPPKPKKRGVPSGKTQSGKTAGKKRTKKDPALETPAEVSAGISAQGNSSESALPPPCEPKLKWQGELDFQIDGKVRGKSRRMKTPEGAIWTPAETTLLKELLAEAPPLTVEQIAERLGRSLAETEEAVRLLSLHDLSGTQRAWSDARRKAGYAYWTSEQYARLSALLKGGLSPQAIAETLGKPVGAVRAAIGRLAERENLKPNDRTRWTEKDAETLRGLFLSGLGTREIADRMLRSFASIGSQLRRMGLYVTRRDAARKDGKEKK